ncbi:ATP-binding protein [Nitriliruptor alkaliphilus]|uniref:DNA polymerase III subunit n=1 Tax=Nitriliruptor alkaliphilus TaxID=427918 RepID=UPI000697F9A6|nr:DNA polymerase III subunit delta' C-terminal domain-containing protein [Nitriliruptor alkaliphilus]
MSATWDEVLGQPAAVEALRGALRADEVAHAWLLMGPTGVGQREATRAFAAALNCPDRTEDAGCGGCSTCLRIGRGVHPAVETFEPEGQFHLVDAVHDWITTASRSMTEGQRRVLRIVAADRMNEAAQNAFLKILEEPPPSVVWVLEASDESALLDTILSRCRRLAVVPWGPDALRQLATRELGVAADQAADLARASLGSPERLRDLADPELAEARWQHLAIIDRLATGGPGQVVPLAKELTVWARGRVAPLKEKHQAEFAGYEESYGVDERGRGWPPGVKKRLEQRHARLERAEMRRALDSFLDTLASQLRDLLAVSAGGSADHLINVDHLASLQRDATRLPPVAAIEGLQAVARCREALDRNGAPELQLERLLLAVALPLYAQATAS